MKVTINRREFLDAARRALSVAPQGSPLDVLKCILLEADASTGKLTITATIVAYKEIDPVEFYFAINNS